MCELCVFSLSDGSEMGIVYMCESISVYGLKRDRWSESMCNE